jgi:micrococcal nuclease
MGMPFMRKSTLALRTRAALTAAFFSFAAGLAHADFTGKVIAVLDGDTVDVLVENRPIRVRAAEIDAPERAQPWGTRSRQTLAALIFGKSVTVLDAGLDWRGTRIVGTILLDGQSMNREMVRAGMAWVYPQYVKDRSLYVDEAAARAAKLGLWADASPVPPWQWRAAKRAGSAGQSAIGHRSIWPGSREFAQ